MPNQPFITTARGDRRAMTPEENIMLSRRNLVLTIGGIAADSFAPRLTLAQALPTTAGPFTLDPLPYPINALEPYIDGRTMELHHDRHHAGYVNNLNAISKDYPQLGRIAPQDLLQKLAELPEAIRTGVRNNLGGHLNHTVFWRIMKGGGGKPSGDVAAAINRDFGGIEKLTSDFNSAGGRVFGSGWVFVTVTRDGKLAIETRPNQDSPLMDGKNVLFGNDVWEHAYYLNYQNRRADYLNAWWNVVNWPEINKRYAAAKAGTLSF
jgi:superoxide dismutase, Fe-Mn family